MGGIFTIFASGTDCHATQTTENNPAPDAGPHLGNRRCGGGLPHLRRRPDARHYRVDSLDARQVRCQSDLLRAGQERRDVSRPLPAHPRRRPQGGQPYLLPPEGVGHEPGALYGGCGFCQRFYPQRAVPSALCPHHAGAGAAARPALQAGDVGHHLARLQPPPLAALLSEERDQVSGAGLHRGLSRQREVLPQHALCAAPDAALPGGSAAGCSATPPLASGPVLPARLSFRRSVLRPAVLSSARFVVPLFCLLPLLRCWLRRRPIALWKNERPAFPFGKGRSLRCLGLCSCGRVRRYDQSSTRQGTVQLPDTRWP